MDASFNYLTAKGIIVTVKRFCFLSALSSNKLNKQEQIQQNIIVLQIFIVVICQVLLSLFDIGDIAELLRIII